MAEKQQTSRRVRIIGLVPVILIGALVILSGLVTTVPVFFNEDKTFRHGFYTQPTVFTTYFYWYRAGESRNPALSPHVTENWDQQYIDSIATKEWPADWPGPKTAAEMNINSIHDSLSHHPLASPPIYDTNGSAIEPLYTTPKIMENISKWFDWQNSTWHEWEMRCMIRAGIDVLMPVYWWNGKQNIWADEGLVTLVSTWHRLNQSLENLPTIAMFFDTTCMKQLYCDNLTHDKTGPYYQNYTKAWETERGPDLDNQYWREQFWLCIDRFYAVVDADAAYNYNNASVVWLYSGGWFSNVGTGTFDYCRSKFAEKYHRGLLFVGESGWLKAGSDGVCGWGACCPGPVDVYGKGIPVGGVGPGYYNLGAIAIQPAIYHHRDVTEYKAKWHSLIDEGAAWIHVETWNEYHEGTDISWTQEYGYQWIDATREMADKLHQIDPNGQIWEIQWGALFIPLIGLLGLCMLIPHVRREETK